MDSNLRIGIDGKGAESGAKQVVRSLDEIRASARQTVGTVEGTGQSIEASGSKFSSMATKVGLAVAALFSFSKAAELIKESALISARVETLGIVMERVGANAGYTREQVHAYAQGVREAGITTEISRQAIVRFLQANIDLEKSQRLARLAQEAAVIGNINSSDALERMSTAMATGLSTMLHRMGIMANLGEAEQAYAKSIGKTTEQLTELERGQARADAVLKAGENIQGAYAAAMETTGKQLTSLPRYIIDVKESLGELFSPALGDAVRGMTVWLKGIRKDFDDWKASGSIDRVAEQIRAVVDGLGHLAKVAGEGLALYAVYRVIMITAGAVGTLNLQIHLAAMEAKGAAGWMGVFNTSLTGTSLAANLAAGSITKLQLAIYGLGAFILGWEIGKWLTDNFQIAREAGVWFVSVMVNGWENLRYTGELSFIALKGIWYDTIAAMMDGASWFVSQIAGVFGKIPGMGDVSRNLQADAKRLADQAAGYSNMTVEAMKKATEEHIRNKEAISATIDEMMGEAATPPAAARKEFELGKPGGEDHKEIKSKEEINRIEKLNKDLTDVVAKRYLTEDELAEKQARDYLKKGADKLIVEKWLASEKEKILLDLQKNQLKQDEAFRTQTIAADIAMDQARTEAALKEAEYRADQRRKLLESENVTPTERIQGTLEIERELLNLKALQTLEELKSAETLAEQYALGQEYALIRQQILDLETQAVEEVARRRLDLEYEITDLIRQQQELLQQGNLERTQQSLGRIGGQELGAGLEGIQDLAGGMPEFGGSLAEGEDQYSKEFQQWSAMQDQKIMALEEMGASEAAIKDAWREYDLQAEQTHAQQRVAMSAATFGMLGSIAEAFYNASGKKGGAAFEIMKAMRIGETVMNTYSAAVGAYNAMVGIPIVGPALAVAAAAAAVAFGFAQVRAIASMKPGATGAASIGTGTAVTPGTMTGPPSYSRPYEESETKQRQASYEINFYGPVYDHDKLAREVMPSIMKAIGDNAQ